MHKRSLASVLVFAAVGLAMAQHDGNYKNIDQSGTPAPRVQAGKVVVAPEKVSREDLRYTFMEYSPKKPEIRLIYWYERDKAGQLVRMTYVETGRFTRSIHPFRRE